MGAITPSRTVSPHRPCCHLLPHALSPPFLQSQDVKDKLLRALADMENLRERTARTTQEAKTFAVQVGGWVGGWLGRGVSMLEVIWMEPRGGGIWL